jgi:DNA-binding FrmR family transcriptional regulator
MPELTALQKQLKNRLARLNGQITALSRMVDKGEDWVKMLELAAAVEGATDQVTADLFEGYLDSIGNTAVSKEARKALSLVLKRL